MLNVSFTPSPFGVKILGTAAFSGSHSKVETTVVEAEPKQPLAFKTVAVYVKMPASVSESIQKGEPSQPLPALPPDQKMESKPDGCKTSVSRLPRKTVSGARISSGGTSST